MPGPRRSTRATLALNEHLLDTVGRAPIHALTMSARQAGKYQAPGCNHANDD